MMFNTSLVALVSLASLASAHMKMSTPVPYGKSTLNNSPLVADGSDFPCKQRNGVYDAEGASNTLALGSTQKLAFIGSATHGGGSCQVSITYDQAPTKNSVFKVIHSIEGGCPIKGVAGNTGEDASAVDPDTYSFTVPTNLPAGTATLAWTWFNKIGNREMYMNCAPITLTAAASKRGEDEELLARNITQLMERDTAAYNALPDMFVANVGNGCATVDSADLSFPAPGDSLEQDGLATATPSPPVGSGCGSTLAPAAAATAGPSGAGTISAAPVATSAPAVSPGVFATVPASQPQVSASTAPVATASANSVVPVASPAPAAASPASSGTSGADGAIAAGTACTPEGTWNCIGGTSFQRCASGTWSVVQQLAAGTKCTSGQSDAIDITSSGKTKRAVRFSGAHIRRHLARSS